MNQGAHGQDVAPGTPSWENRYGATLLKRLMVGAPAPDLGDGLVPIEIRFPRAEGPRSGDPLLVTAASPEGVNRRVLLAVRRPLAVALPSPLDVLPLAPCVHAAARCWSDLRAGRVDLVMPVARVPRGVEYVVTLSQLAREFQHGADLFREVARRFGEEHYLVEALHDIDRAIAQLATRARLDFSIPLTWRVLHAVRVRECRVDTPGPDVARLQALYRSYLARGGTATVDSVLDVVGRSGGAETTEAGTANSVDFLLGQAVQAENVNGDVNLGTVVNVIGASTGHPSLPEQAETIRVGVVPLPADCYRTRSEEHRGTPSTGTVLISGLGGVGKTQIAALIARERWQDASTRVALWITATSREGVVSAYAEAAIKLRIATHHQAPQHAADVFLSWLSSAEHRWLVVLDDLEAPGIIRGLRPPRTAAGLTLVTTRRQDAALLCHASTRVQVGVFSPDESHSYMRDKLSGSPHLLDGAEQVARQVGHLPLALAQAVTYIVDRDLTCASYLNRLNDGRTRLGQLVPEDDGLPDDQQRSLSAVWSLSIDLADSLTPRQIARPVLAITSVLDGNGVPISVFATPPVLAHLSELAGRRVEPDEATDGLQCLARVSLAQVDKRSAHREVSLHAMVQRGTRESLSERSLESVVDVAADALMHVWPVVENDLTLSASLRANVTALENVAGGVLWTRGRYQLLERSILSLHNTGLPIAGLDHVLALRDDCWRHLGPGNAFTLRVRDLVALFHGQVGDPVNAVSEFQSLLDDRTALLGADHPETLRTRHDVAIWRAAIQPAAPTSLSELVALLEDQRRVLGEHHDQTLVTRHSIAQRTVRNGGSARAAVDTLARLLADQTELLGEDHPDTLVTAHSLGRWLGEADSPAAAVIALEPLLEKYIRVFGVQHPYTLATRNNIARWRGEARHGAIDDYEQLVAEQTATLGAEHPYTLASRRNLARQCARARDYRRALDELAQLTGDFTRLFGAHHVDTFSVRTQCAQARHDSGDSRGAVEDLEAVLTDQREVWPDGSLYVKRTRTLLESWRSE